MRLPAENTLRLPTEENLLCVDASDPPAVEGADVAALAPAWVRRGEAALRDAVFGALAAVGLLVWGAFGRELSSHASPRFAAGLRLREWARTLRRPVATGEEDHELRARLLSPPARVSPEAIIGAVRALVLAETPVAPHLLEPAEDLFFVPSSSSPWVCFVQPVAGRLWAYDPAREGVRWGTYWHTTALLPEFWVVLQGDVSGDAEGVFLLPRSVAPEGAADAETDYIGPPPPSAVASWGYVHPARDSLEARVQREVETRRMYGVRWALLIDPYLENAR